LSLDFCSFENWAGVCNLKVIMAKNEIRLAFEPFRAIFNDLLRFLSGLILVTVAFVQPAAWAQVSTTQFIQEILELPQSKPELMKLVEKEFTLGVYKTLDQFLLSSSSYSTQSLIDSLNSNEDPQVVARYFDELMSDENSRLKLIVALANEFKKHPDSLLRVERAIDDLRYQVERDHGVSTDLGFRTLNGSLLFMDMISISYSAWFLHHDNSAFAQSFISGSDLLNVCIVGIIASSLFKEAVALKSTLSLRMKLRKLRAKRKLRVAELQKMISVLKTQPEVRDQLQKRKYILSESSEKSALEAYRNLLSKISKTFEGLNLSDSIQSQMAKDLLHRVHLLEKRFKKSLNPQELKAIYSHFKKDEKEALSIGLRMKLKSLGISSYAQIQKWMKRYGQNKRNTYKLALRERQEDQEDFIALTHGAHTLMKLNTVGLALGSALYSLNFAVGIGPTELDQHLLWGLGSVVRQYSQGLIYLATALAVGPFIPHATGVVYQKIKNRIIQNKISTDDVIEQNLPSRADVFIGRSWLFESANKCEESLL